MSCGVSDSRRRFGGGGGFGGISGGNRLNGVKVSVVSGAGDGVFDGNGECALISCFDDEAIGCSRSNSRSCVRWWILFCLSCSSV